MRSRMAIGCVFFMAVALVAGIVPSTAQAAVSPLGVAILPPVQFPPEDFNIAGVRASVIWGKHRRVYGFDLGAIGNITTLEFVGIAAAGGFNYNQASATVIGLQVAGGANVNGGKTSVVGVQVAGGLNLNYAETSVIGLQLAALGNHSPFAKIYGLQVGLYNRANEVFGLQVGLVNFAQDLHGIQIGLINFNAKGLFAVAPILNVGF